MSKAESRKQKVAAPRRQCRVCGRPEVRQIVGGTIISNLAQHLGICAKCIGHVVLEVGA